MRRQKMEKITSEWMFVQAYEEKEKAAESYRLAKKRNRFINKNAEKIAMIRKYSGSLRNDTIADLLGMTPRSLYLIKRKAKEYGLDI